MSRPETVEPTPGGDRVLIVNADDFGLSAGVNAGILQAHAAGIVTSTSLMVKQPLASEAVRSARRHPRLDLGLHLDLGHWDLIDGEWVLRAAGPDPRDAGATRSEMEDQVERFVALRGAAPTHLDSHQHVHRSGSAASVAAALAERLRVPLRDASTVRFCGDFYGQDRHGVSRPEWVSAENLMRIVRELGPGATEVSCHPAAVEDAPDGYRAERVQELQALCDPGVRAEIEARGIVLAGFSERDPASAAEQAFARSEAVR